MTELTWEGKYKDGKKVTPVRIALPFQTIETINESNAERVRQQGFSFDRKTEWRNRLIWGDKKYVLPSLLPEFAGKVNLIYIDPPFNVGADFSFTAKIPAAQELPINQSINLDDPTEFLKEPSIIEQKAYRDTWGRGLDSYMQWFYETALLLKELLTAEGSLFIHIGSEVASYVRCVTDEVFGRDNFRNEIILPGRAVKNLQQQFASIQKLQVRHDTLLWYSKSPQTRFEPVWFDKHNLGNPEGHWHHFWSTANRPTMRYEFLGVTPTSGQWVWKEERALRALANYERFQGEGGGRTLAEYWRDTGAVLEFTRAAPDDGKPQYWREPAEMRIADTVWSGIPIYSAFTKYPTEKNEKLLTQVLEIASNEGDLVLDCFCGSGTTAAVAEKLNRRWITCDLGRFAIHTARKRLLGIENVHPFVVQNLGKYERQQWMNAEFESEPGAIATGFRGDTAKNPVATAPGSDSGVRTRLQQERDYRHFIVDLYHAKPLDGYTWLHGAKAGRMVHVGSVEAPVTVEDIKSTIKEFWKMAGGENAAETNGIDFLGWDFAFDVNETAAHFANANNVKASFKKIPREVLEKKAVEQGDIKFYELASLGVDVKTGKKQIEVTLKDFIIPPDDIPEEVRGKITHWSQWIDYWAIDWNYRDDTFHNEWQSYRTKKEPKIDLTALNTDVKPGKYTVLVKVIDILGNDTTKAIEVEV